MQKRFDLRLGDSRAVLKLLPDNSVDSVCCDPPYALDTIVKRWGGENAAPPRIKEGTDGAFGRVSSGFMGQMWDTGETAFSAAFWAEVLRVLKPGGYLVAFSGSRTYHRLACAIEDAGFLIEDMIAWLYGSGMPKSHKPSIYLERLLCTRQVADDGSISWFYADGEPQRSEPPFRHPQANAWWGYGSALKPGLEPICLAQKPLIGTMAENILAWQVGVLNVDAARIPVEGEDNPSAARRLGATNHLRNGKAAESEAAGRIADRRSPEAYRAAGVSDHLGRWPANVAHDGSDVVLGAFPDTPGMKAPVGPENSSERTGGTIYKAMGARFDHSPRDTGGSASRFFYGSKASRADREEGCEDLPDGILARSNAAIADAEAGDVVDEGEAGSAFNTARTRKNNHPTVKPTDVMQWICRLVTPAGGVILDPFMGSGSTGKAAMLEGFRFIGIEREAPFFAIAEARVARAALRRDVSPPQADLFAAE